MPLDPTEIRKQLRESFTQAIAAGQPKKARRLLESFWLFDGFGGSDLWDRFRPRSNDGDGEAWVPPSVPTDRRHGSNWPLWRNQPELDWLRQESRLRAQTNSFAQGMLRNLVNNVIGKGYSYKVHALDDDDQPLSEEEMSDEDKRYVRGVQEVVDNFLKKNHWNCSIDPTDVTALAATRERDIFRTVMIDGEAFIRFHGQPDGMMIVRPIDSSQVRDGGKYLPQEGWTYGIQHQMEPFEDVETSLTFAVFWPDASAKGGEGGGANDYGTWEEIDAEEVLHLKGADTPSNIKRGTGLFLYDVGRALDRASKLQNNISAGAAVRSAIAETVQLSQATQPQIQNMAQALATHSRTDPVTGRQTPVERIPPGTIRRVPEGWELVQPSADYSESYLTGKDGDLQMAAAGAGIASFVLGGLESGNYSNFESASYPPVQNAVCEQEYFKLAFARVVWKAIQWAMKCGQLPADVLGRVTLVVEAPAVLHRNELEKAQEDQISVTMGWKDRQTCASERGLDWKQVEANNEDYQKAQNELMPQPMPGQGGKPGGGANGQTNGQGPKPPKPKPPQGDRGVREAFDPSEPRDEEGKWTSGGGAEPSGQKRAKKGGEIAPNGEHYAGGTFIATTELPKMARTKLAKLGSGKEPIAPYQWAVPEPGMIPLFRIYGPVAGAFANNRPDDVSDTSLAYLGHSREEFTSNAARYASGERFVKAEEFPHLMNFSDVAKMVKAGLPLPEGSPFTLEDIARRIGAKPDQVLAASKPQGDRGVREALDRQGGIVPEKPEAARKVDLITLPEDIQGTNCFNCRFVDRDKSYCNNPEVDQHVNERMCCALWDAEGTRRNFKESAQREQFPVFHVHSAPITLNLPHPPAHTLNVAPSPAPDVKVIVESSPPPAIHIAPSPAPEVNVHVDPSPAPEVKVLVEAAEAPQVNIQNTFEVPPPQVTVNPPDVHVNVEAPPPVQVHVTNEPPVIHNEIEIPPPASQVETMEVVRDEEGRIAKTKKKITPLPNDKK